MLGNPVNYRKRDPQCLQADVDYALSNASDFCRLINKCGLSVDGLRFLELGPGINFGVQLILASMGARVSLADRFLAAWDDDYHPELYRQLAAKWDGPKHCLEAVISAGGYGEHLTLIEAAAEDLGVIPDGSMDFILSNAVFEHIYDLPKVSREIARVLRVGGRGSHQIDMRDHRDFERPIEHLTMLEVEFEAVAKESHYEFGNRYRSAEFWAHFESAGLLVTEREINSIALPGYQSDALPRLRQSQSAYRNWPAEDVFRIGGRFFLVKVDTEQAALLKQRAQDALDLVEALKQASSVPSG